MIPWESWRRSREQKRLITSYGVAIGLLLLVLLGLWIAGQFHLVTLSDALGDSLSVKLGRPDAEDKPLAVTPQQSYEQSAVQETIEQNVVPPQAKIPEKTSPDGLQPVKDKEKKLPQPSVPPKTVEKKLDSVASKPSEAVKPDTSSNVQKTLRGVENGNSVETVFQGTNSRIGRTMYVPVYLYMPLPGLVDDAVVKRIGPSKDGLQTAEERKALWVRFYEPSGRNWRLKASVEYSDRPALWIILQNSGYDIDHAEYKTQKTLNPVVLRFTLSPAQPGNPPRLTQVVQESFSGSPDVDGAVNFAFRQAVFANGTGADATGVFTYDFTKN